MNIVKIKKTCKYNEHINTYNKIINKYTAYNKYIKAK